MKPLRITILLPADLIKASLRHEECMDAAFPGEERIDTERILQLVAERVKEINGKN